MIGQLISLGIGSPADVTAFLLFGLSMGAQIDYPETVQFTSVTATFPSFASVTFTAPSFSAVTFEPDE